MKFELRWSDIGHAKLSGRYPFRGSAVDLQDRHIFAWEQDPDGVWELPSYIGSNGRTHYGVTAFTPSAAFERRRASDPALKIQSRRLTSRRTDGPPR